MDAAQIVFNVITVIALIGGPVAAVRITRYLDDKKEHKGRRLSVFKDLMVTRAYTLSFQHVQALNRIDVEFSLPGDEAVLEAWKVYLDFLSQDVLADQQWAQKRIELEVDLLQKMGLTLGYRFEKTHIKNVSYQPRGHADIDAFNNEMRTAMRELMAGKRAIPIIPWTPTLADDMKVPQKPK